MHKKNISIILAMTMTASMLTACNGITSGSGPEDENATGTGALADTAKIDSAIENASAVEDLSGYIYTGEAPITQDGGTLKILAQ